ncbi:MAG: asparagine synthase (glutamine-hydrolyzing) [Promethearchaeota archaeon]
MCGICGFNWENRNVLKKMCKTLIHRGPDDEGFYTDARVSMGMRRLSIFDLKTGHQPQHDEEQEIWIVFDGEIYNFLDLKKILIDKGHSFYTSSDTEVIIHSYEEWGYDCVKKFRGPFAFCIYDSRKNLLFLARDHMGLKPLYYYFDGEVFIFSSELKAIFCHDIKKELDKEALNFYLSLRYIPFDCTLIKGIKKIPPSHFMVFNLKLQTISLNKYWNINFNVNTTHSPSQLALELRNLLEESVKLRLISDAPLGAFLSGGIDSSSIVALMSNLLDQPVKTFSMGFEEGAPINETHYSKFVAEYYNIDHEEILVKSPDISLISKVVWHLDDLVSDAAAIPVYLMAQNARKRMIVVALTGDGADEVFAGYSVYYIRKNRKILNYVPKPLLNVFSRCTDLIPSFNLKILNSYLSTSTSDLDHFLREIIYITDEEKQLALPFKFNNVREIVKSKINKNLDFITQTLIWDQIYQLPNQYNMKIDKMTMAASLEARVPFLDWKIINWASQIPSHLKINKSIEKYILRLAMKDILPSTILKRKKMGFSTPVNFWLKTGLKDLSNEIFKRLSKRTNIIKYKYIKIINKNREKLFHVNRAWNLLMFELWYETFMESDGLHPINNY